MAEAPSQPILIALSDATGETAEQACKAALAQFGRVEDSSVRVVPHVLSDRALEAAVLQAKQTGALLAYTLVGPELRTRVKELSDQHRVTTVDLLGPLIARIARQVGQKPLKVPGLGHELDEDYFRRIEAVEFAVNNDDGKLPQNLPKAEIVIVGISRTSKTPLSNYIAHRGYKVSNVPLVLDVPLPRQLTEVDPRRVFGLLIDPVVLMKIRKARMETLRMSADSDYGDLRHIRHEIRYAKKIFAEHPEWTIIDITRKAVEETAAQVLETYRTNLAAPPKTKAKRKTRKKAGKKKATAKKKVARKDS